MSFTPRVWAWGWMLLWGLHGGSLVAAELGPWQSSTPAVRAQAAIAAGRTPDEASVPWLIGLLKDPEKDVRREAARALGQIRDSQAVAALVEALGDGDKNVRFYAADALGEIKDPRSAPALLESLHDPEWCVRDQAAWALREIRDPEVLVPLAAMLKEPQADVAHIGWIVQQLGGAQGVAALAGLLSNPNRLTRKRAMEILTGFPPKTAFAPLAAALRDADAEIRGQAVAALVKTGDSRVEHLLGELAVRESDAAVRAAVDKALRRYSADDALAAYWSFDDHNPKIARDVTGHGNDGQIEGATPVEGKVGSALKFGPGTCVELGRPSHLNIAKQPFTIMAWIKSDADRGVVVARGGAATGYCLYLKDGLPKFGILRTRAERPAIAAGREPVGGAWTHLAGVVKDDCVELYVNGRLAAKAKSNGCLPGNCGQGMEIGVDKGNSAAEITDNFQGIIDEVKQFSAALTDEQIARQCRTK